MLSKLKANRDEITAQIRSLSLRIEADGRKNMNAAEERQYTELAGERAQIDARIQQLTDEDARAATRGRSAEILGQSGRADISGVAGNSFGRGADTVYGRGSGQSYFLDLASAAMPGSSEAYAATQRLAEHAQLVDRAASDLPSEFRASMSKRAAGQGLETRVNPNRTDGQGGYFVPPLWLVDEWVTLLRAGRTTADLTKRGDLPTGTDSINLPKVNTGATTATQLDAGTVSSTDITDTFVSAPVRTIAGGQDVAMQLLDQSPIAFDEVIYADLLSSYNQQLDLQVLNGSGTSGQLKGILQVSGINAITYTDASPTVPKLYPAFGQAASQIGRQLYRAPSGIVMTPQRWGWITGALDTQSRPLVTPDAGQGMNIVANQDAGSAEGLVGNIGGVPVYVDANLPTNLGAGTNQDEILVGRFDAAYLWEGAMRTRALVEVLSGTLQVRLQLWNYVAFMPDRYPAAWATVGGTGLIVPAGY